MRVVLMRMRDENHATYLYPKAALIHFMTAPLHIRAMYATDFQRGFREVLGALSAVTLADEEAMVVFRKRLRSRVLTFVALVDDRVVGTASLLIETKFIHNGGCVGHIEDVAVLPELQGHGVGHALIHHLIEESRKARCYKVILDCDPKIVPWYESLGFRPWCQAMRLDLDVFPPASQTEA